MEVRGLLQLGAGPEQAPLHLVSAGMSPVQAPLVGAGPEQASMRMAAAGMRPWAGSYGRCWPCAGPWC